MQLKIGKRFFVAVALGTISFVPGSIAVVAQTGLRPVNPITDPGECAGPGCLRARDAGAVAAGAAAPARSGSGLAPDIVDSGICVGPGCARRSATGPPRVQCRPPVLQLLRPRLRDLPMEA